MNILILNWRDIKNPSSGGAEILTHEMAKRWVAKGHSVIQLSSHFTACKEEDIIDGVRIIRKGHPDIRYFFSSIHFLSFVYYLKNFRGKVDVVIDEVHGIPFFTPWYVKEKKIVLSCEVAGNLWYSIFGFVFGSVGKYTEKFYLRYIYRGIPFLTISQSTKKDLLQNGIPESDITILPMGISLPKKSQTSKKNLYPTLLFVGRLTKQKGVDYAIYTLKEVIKHFPKTHLWIVGRGEKSYEEHLKHIVKKQHMSQHVTFFGYVSEEEKFNLMGKAHILLHPSLHEGFGLTVPESARVGTPAVAYNSSGLRDLIENGKNGILLKENTSKAMAGAVISLLEDGARYKKLSLAARQASMRFDWDKTAQTALRIMKKNL